MLSFFPRIFRKTDRGHAGGQGIVLVTSPPWSIHGPPLGLAYLATWLRTHGVSMDVFDFNIALYRAIDPTWHKLWLPEYKNHWSNSVNFLSLLEAFSGEIDRAVERILDYGRPVVGFSVVDPKERTTIEIIRRLHRASPSKRIVLGGPAVSTHQQRSIFVDTIGQFIDCYIVGEGEHALLGLMTEYETVGYPSPGPERGNPPDIRAEPVRDIDSVPFPTYEEFDFSMYEGGGRFVEWSRGCIGSCTYCKGRNLLGRYRMKNPENILSEIQWNFEHGTAKHFFVCDNLLNGNVEKLERVCDLIMERKLSVTWEGQGLPHRRMTPALLKKMRQAGCLKIQWGLESGSDKVLGIAGKGKIFSVSDASRVIRDSHDSGIETELFIMVGLLGEDEEEFSKTMRFISDHRGHISKIKSINTLHLVHGTDLMNDPEGFGLHLPERNWHYLWTADGGANNYPVRAGRVRELIDLADHLQIMVQEHNLFEGEPWETTGPE